MIARVRRLARAGRGVVTGIGDDCAVLRVPPGHEALVTTDFSLEGVHFRRQWHPAEAVGHRCLTRGLSDIAAMGGEPVAAFLSLALPRDLPQSWVDEFVRGFLKLAKRWNVPLAGGDTAESLGGVLADIIVVGSVEKGRAILRSGARAGDVVYVTGSLGGAAATLDLLYAHPQRKLNPAEHARHFFPEPRIAVGRALRSIATAMIDISDGLSTDLAHICEESGVGAEIRAEAIPRARIGRPAKTVDLTFSLHGGDDYELIFTAPASRRVPRQMAGVKITPIGRIIRGKKSFLVDENGRRSQFHPQGWEHFTASRHSLGK